eukprot:scaffold30419_cov31-Tisochrysis_lutea.AAC.6
MTVSPPWRSNGLSELAPCQCKVQPPDWYRSELDSGPVNRIRHGLVLVGSCPTVASPPTSRSTWPSEAVPPTLTFAGKSWSTAPIGWSLASGRSAQRGFSRLNGRSCPPGCARSSCSLRRSARSRRRLRVISELKKSNISSSL